MSIAWNYLDKRSAAMAALKDYCSMKAILATTAEEIANVRQDMVRIGGMRFEESAHGARNPQAGENQILHGIAEIDVLEERKRQAEEFMAWFQPAWDALGEDEKTVLTMFYLSENGKTDAIEEISERFCVERSSAYKKKDRAGALGAAAVWEVKRGERIRRNRCDKMINSWRSALVLKRERFLTAFFVTKSRMQNPFGGGIPEGIAEYYFLHLSAPTACAFFLLPSAHST